MKMNEELSLENRQNLLSTVKQAIRYGLDHHKNLPININHVPPELQIIKTSFVTLTINNQLRGCIGSLLAHRPLIEDIAHNAYAAAFSDPRFPALTENEFEQLHVYLSILSDSSTMAFSSEADLLQQIRPDIDGLILEDKGQRGTFLPSVWEQLPDPKDFLNHLKQKAGLPANYWSKSLKVSRYTVESIS